MIAFFKKAKDKIKNLWETKVANHLSTRTRTYIGLLAIPGAILKVGVVVAAGASLLHIVGPYALALAITTTTASAGLIVRDLIRNKRMVEWTNAAGQKIKSSRLAREELRDIQKKLDRFSHSGGKKKTAAKKLTAHFNRFASKVSVMEDVPQGNGSYRFIYQGEPLS